MPANIVVGSQWGDEGKGKIIDIMASRADVVVRATGGNNAGHTVDFHRKPEDRPSCSCGYAVAYRTGRSVGEFPWQL